MNYWAMVTAADPVSDERQASADIGRQEPKRDIIVVFSMDMVVVHAPLQVFWCRGAEPVGELVAVLGVRSADDGHERLGAEHAEDLGNLQVGVHFPLGAEDGCFRVRGHEALVQPFHRVLRLLAIRMVGGSPNELHDLDGQQ